MYLLKIVLPFNLMVFSPRPTQKREKIKYTETQHTTLTIQTVIRYYRVPTAQGKHREFGNFAKTQGIWFAQVVNSLILKPGKEFCNIAVKISTFFRSWIGLPSQFCVFNSHKLYKFAVGQGKHREFENTI